MKYYTFDCGCKFPIVGDLDQGYTGGRPSIVLNPDVEELNLECEKTWDLISSGNLAGCFQLESKIGQQIAKDLKPRSIEILSDAISLIRPGSRNVFIDKKSVTNHYIDRKNGEEAVEYYHPALKNILFSTYGLLVYQEQALLIVQQIAGFTGEQSETLRKAIGKKDIKLMKKVETQFLDGCKKKGTVDTNEAKEIFSWIKESQNYSFNKCLGLDTIVETKDGEFKTLEDVQIGEYIRTPSGDSEVINKHYNGVKKLYEVKLNRGKTIRCTIDHNFLCQDGGKHPLWEILAKDIRILTLKTKDKSDIILRRIQFDNIISIEDIGKFSTMDLEINNESHLFYANGIATSNSHGICYAKNCYLSAYAKAHFPKAFFTSYLYYSQEDPETLQTINLLSNNAKSMNVKVLIPDIRHSNAHFKLIGNDINFGLSDIKGVGNSAVLKIKKVIIQIEKKLDKDVADWKWIEFLIYASQKINKTAVTNLIAVGALDYMGEQRTKMLYDYNVYSKISGKMEPKWCEDYLAKAEGYLPSLLDIIKALASAPTGTKQEGYGCSGKVRLKKVQDLLELLSKPSYSLKDNAAWISGKEEELLGISITCSIVESCNISAKNCDCKQFTEKRNMDKLVMIPVEIQNVKETKTVNGKNPGQKMAFLTVSDNSGMMDSVVVFPQEWIKFKGLCMDGNTVMLSGERGERQDSLIIRKIFQI